MAGGSAQVRDWVVRRADCFSISVERLVLYVSTPVSTPVFLSQHLVSQHLFWCLNICYLTQKSVSTLNHELWSRTWSQRRARATTRADDRGGGSLTGEAQRHGKFCRPVH